MQLDPENVPAAWASGGSSTSVQGQGVKVGIIDTGAQATNEALSGRISWFKDYVDTANTTPNDAYGHGTVVAEILGGTANSDGPDGDAFAGGVAPQASLYVARAGDASGNFNLSLLPQIYSDLLNQGVRLFNNSYNIDQSITSQTNAAGGTPALEQTYFQAAVNAGGLLIWAAGNDGRNQPNIEPGLPYLEPSLQKGWLAVVNVTIDPSTGKVVGLDTSSEPSNACGVAAAWCLAAPGYLGFTPVTGTQFATGAGDGTSFSAPIVTGIAALVWQRFPYFTGNNVQETLLGTATSLGDPALYGYGLVNAAAAVNGPGLLAWGVFDVTIPSGESGTFSNNMSGTGTLQLDGSGSLTLTGTDRFGGITMNGGTLTLAESDTFTGDVSVNGGVFASQSALSAAQIDVAQAGELKASGVVTGNVVNAGVLDSRPLSTSTAGLQIQGNYTATSSANTIIAMGSPLEISNQASLGNSSVTVVASSITSPVAGLLLQANGGVQGEFGAMTVQSGVFTSGTLSYTPTQVDVVLSRPSVTGVALTSMPNVATTQQTAQHIQTALDSTDVSNANRSSASPTFLQAEGEFLDVATIPDAVRSIDSLSGQILVSSQALTFAQADLVNQTIANRMAQTDDAPVQRGFWIQATGADGAIGTNGFATGTYSGGGSVAGLDTAVGEHATLGIAADWNRLGATYNLQAGSNSSRTNGGMLYGRYDVGDAYFSGRAGEDWISSNTSRWGILNVQSDAISSTRKDRLTSLYAETGYVVRHTDWSVTPFVSMAYTQLDRGRIDEGGAGGYGIVAASETFKQSDAQLGTRMAYQWTWAGYQTALQAYALYQRTLSGTNLSFDAAYAGATQAIFELEGVGSPRNSGWVGIGLTTQQSDRWDVYLDLDDRFTSGATRSKTLSVGLRVRF